MRQERKGDAITFCVGLILLYLYLWLSGALR